MTTNEHAEEAADLLQELGLKEYEAKCFVGLTRVPTGTAKKLSEITDVPRTRIYDAIRVLEAQGLVEIQHSSPQQFRAVPLEEATETLREQYESRVERLRGALESVDDVDSEAKSPVQEVWTLSGQTAIATRANKLVEDATDEVVLVVGDDSVLTEELVDRLNDTAADVAIGAVSTAAQTEIQDAVPDATTFTSGLEWLRGENDPDHDVAIGRLMLVDRSSFLVSSIMPDSHSEQAIFGTGVGNGLVVVARRLIAQGLLPSRDPGQGDA
ncbi:TrmB family transcriptional regulator [Halobacterium sp. CBA1126]|uniref:TrmB family transcriptional regulator n=1 Tax=Halobacterium sp. CBA1126 TaxID=2668074 RepID=UPI0012FB5A82|nr:helix-turn-helix domain-containing protein [Halobacterium sp. CBA1126]MUV61188.1 TrmB family transcriptional regulator [Halobacterium sp. CBA1126]